VVLLDFEGVWASDVPSTTAVGDYYGGGAGGPARDYGIVFGPSAGALVDSDAAGAGGTPAAGFFANEPSPSTAVEFSFPEALAYVNVAGGFTGLAFQYASVEDASVAEYSGPDRTGTVLGTFPLPAPGECPADCGDPTGTLGIWRNFTVPFSPGGGGGGGGGVARSVGFLIQNTFVLVDDMVITLAAAPPPPTQPPTNVPTKAPTKPTPTPTRRPTRSPTRSPLASECRKGRKGGSNSGNTMKRCIMRMKKKPKAG
jgi:hypothetical protein